MSGRQELESDGLAEFQIVGAVDFTHAPAAEQVHDSVAPAEHYPGYELRLAAEVAASIVRGRALRKILRVLCGQVNATRATATTPSGNLRRA